jgi:predicted RNA binding protein YcfA (HicA-like mRNA interferase family)
VKTRDFLKLIERNGWKVDRIKGSHRQYVHPGKPEAGTLTVPGHPSKDVPKGLLNVMLKQAGVKND